MPCTNIFTAKKQSLTALTKKRIMLDVKISKSRDIDQKPDITLSKE